MVSTPAIDPLARIGTQSTEPAPRAVSTDL